MSVIEDVLVALACSVAAIFLLLLICGFIGAVLESTRERLHRARVRRDVIRADAAMFVHCLRLSVEHFKAASQLRERSGRP